MNAQTAALNIALIGCGKMGQAMLRGWLESKIVNKIYVLDPVPLPEEFNVYVPNPVVYTSNFSEFADIEHSLDLVVMAVKPQIMGEVCETIKPSMKSDIPVVSIAAGQSIAVFEKHFGSEQAVIRAMPNTPAAIGKGITVATANGNVHDKHKDNATTILSAIGDVEWIDDENLLDPVTAVSGSGPAYIFLLIEAMAAAGVKSGLPEDLSMKLARQTVIGSAALAETDNGTDAATLRKNVTSPGGTTEAALKVLMADSDGIQQLFDRAIDAATKRGRELNG